MAKSEYIQVSEDGKRAIRVRLTTEDNVVTDAKVRRYRRDESANGATFDRDPTQGNSR